MDVHVPRAVTTELRLRSIDVLTAQEDGAAQMDDRALLKRATDLAASRYRRTKICCAKECDCFVKAEPSPASSMHTNFASPLGRS
jgi:hypothetical protein